jgi:hypothetical protein
MYISSQHIEKLAPPTAGQIRCIDGEADLSSIECVSQLRQVSVRSAASNEAEAFADIAVAVLLRSNDESVPRTEGVPAHGAVEAPGSAELRGAAPTAVMCPNRTLVDNCAARFGVSKAAPRHILNGFDG